MRCPGDSDVWRAIRETDDRVTGCRAVVEVSGDTTSGEGPSVWETTARSYRGGVGRPARCRSENARREVSITETV